VGKTTDHDIILRTPGSHKHRWGKLCQRCLNYDELQRLYQQQYDLLLVDNADSAERAKIRARIEQLRGPEGELDRNVNRAVMQLKFGQRE